ncbi:toxin-antitoxin system HicB family antitoxin [Amycolatopsis nigrescens]|uniref:toxin-antitoxin system HicB family antitoxin n=1 Tax=Amycolatopsis nigrescens TaxID=381445 RepID=UPI00036F0254|nr:toxin-antitoxin system HicB family antitoxin [Amycolatopsis nigrescens]
MDLTPYITSLREDLAATASAGDEQTQRAAAVLAGALEPAVRLTLMNALADLAAEVTAGLPGQVVEVRLDGRDVRVVVTGDRQPEPPREPERPRTPPPIDGDISRLTLRLVEQIKGQAEQAAASQGVSLNTFISQAVQGALHAKSQFHRPENTAQQGNQTESQLHGWVRG